MQQQLKHSSRKDLSEQIEDITYKTKLKLDKEAEGGGLSELCNITYETRLRTHMLEP